jgi:hypothetical protein
MTGFAAGGLLADAAAQRNPFDRGSGLLEEISWQRPALDLMVVHHIHRRTADIFRSSRRQNGFAESFNSRFLKKHNSSPVAGAGSTTPLGGSQPSRGHTPLEAAQCAAQ